MIYISSDHGGFKLKEFLKKTALQKGFELHDLGPFRANPNDDYPVFAHRLAKEIEARPDKNLGILICRSGQGVCMTANRHKNVRAVVAWSMKLAKMSRVDDLANVICLPADYITEEEALHIVEAFIKTPWGKEVRFKRRAKEIDI